MKKIINFMFLAVLLMPTMVFAKENNIYYTNLNGVNLTQKQYDNLKKVFDDDTIATLEREQIDLLKNNEHLVKVEQTKYIISEEVTDNITKKVKYEDREITEDEAMMILQSNKKMSPAKGPSHQTAMKKITISLVVTHSVKTITITNEWLSLPVTKSYDVIAFRNGTGTSVSISSVSGYQNHDGQITSYGSGSTNLKSTSNGCGISMNIFDNVSNSLSNGMTVTIYNNSTSYTAYGTYQHAQSDVTLSQSQNYSISSGGLGNVLAFNSSVIGYYDGMQGVDITGTVY